MEKLVRDKVPDIIRETGLDPRVRKIEFHNDRRLLLQQKLAEECKEVIDSMLNKDACIEECADLYEVINSVLIYHNVPAEDMMKVRHKKFDERGGFTEFYVIDVPDLQEQIEQPEPEHRGHFNTEPRRLPSSPANFSNFDSLSAVDVIDDKIQIAHEKTGICYVCHKNNGDTELKETHVHGDSTNGFYYVCDNHPTWCQDNHGTTHDCSLPKVVDDRLK